MGKATLRRAPGSPLKSRNDAVRRVRNARLAAFFVVPRASPWFSNVSRPGSVTGRRPEPLESRS